MTRPTLTELRAAAERALLAALRTPTTAAEETER